MKKIILPVTLLSVFLLAGCGNQSAKSAKSSDSSQKTASSKVVSSQKISQKTTQSSQSSSSTSSTSSSSSSSSSQETNDSTIVKHFVMGRTFTIQPELYNGEDVNKAMDEQKAPQNIVHDYTVSVTFDHPSQALLKYILEVHPRHMNYTVNNGILKVGKYNIPYAINGKSVTFLPWKASDGQGGTITYKFTSN